ncbi:MAG TPA: glycosyltransferase [Opitutaceae bacterium]|jgi:glycosyltransferase involved in cell wall biosynthesis|nr:glycosyltransferase [Opitutaceae bacterium]
MNVLHVNYADVAGGAEAVAWRLHEGYRARGHRSRIAVARKRSRDADVVLIADRQERPLRLLPDGFSLPMAGPLARLLRGPRRLCSDLGLALTDPDRFRRRRRGEEDFDFPETWRLLERVGPRPDLLHLHNLHGNYFDLRALPQLSRRVPVFLTLHDPWMLSGHCAHSFDCQRWKNGCGQCPDLALFPRVRRDATAFNWKRKAEIYARSRLYVATPSRWLMRQVEQSMLAPGVVESQVVGNGVDLSVFRPAPAESIRRELGVPPDAFVLLFTAQGARRNPFKDYATVRAAVARMAEALPGRPVILWVLGEAAPTERLGRAEVRFIPFQRRPEDMARYYQAADVCLHGVLAEVWGLTVTEAMACGLPVVGTDIGGVPEQIDDGVNGYCVPVRDSAAMAEAGLRLLRDEGRRRAFGARAAAKARAKFGRDRMEQAYLSWYERVLEVWAGMEPDLRPPGPFLPAGACSAAVEEHTAAALEADFPSEPHSDRSVIA